MGPGGRAPWMRIRGEKSEGKSGIPVLGIRNSHFKKIEREQFYI